VRWLRVLKRWYAPNASTLLEGADLGQQLLRRVVVPTCCGRAKRKLRLLYQTKRAQRF
jgi:hypothetical protein